jgi:hypothetical protein
MAEPLNPETSRQPTTGIQDRAWFWPALGAGVALAMLVSTYLIIRNASDPFAVVAAVMFFLVIGLGVVTFLGVRRGFIAPFVTIAVVLPFVFGAVLYQATVDRVSAELEDAFGSDDTTATDDGDVDLGGELDDELGGDPSEDAGEPVEKLPLMGGSYTWATTGVTMTWTVKSQGKYGETNDVCGDGSCGVLKPNDESWLMHYEVTVPEGAPGVDGYSCPGQLHVTEGNDEDAFVNFGSKDMGEVKPGGTKYGETEYVIVSSAKDQTFYMESTCGADPEGESSETAYLEGVFK